MWQKESLFFYVDLRRKFLCVRCWNEGQNRIGQTEETQSSVPRCRQRRNQGAIWPQCSLRWSIMLSLMIVITNSWTSLPVPARLSPMGATTTRNLHTTLFAKIPRGEDAFLESQLSSADPSLGSTTFDFPFPDYEKNATRLSSDATSNGKQARNIGINDERLTQNTNSSTVPSSVLSSSSDLQTLLEVRARFRQKGQSVLEDREFNGLINTNELVKSTNEADFSTDAFLQQARGQTYWAFVLLVGTYAISCVLTDLLSNFELVQSWRYCWPLGIGGLFIWEGWSGSTIGGTGRSLSWSLPSRSYSSTEERQTLIRLVQVLLGMGLIVGGAADALLPVYVTGPNAITNAGLAPDSAVVLFAWTLWQASKSANASSRHALESSRKNESVVTMLPLLVPPMLLLAQLYKLGEGSFDELFLSWFL